MWSIELVNIVKVESLLDSKYSITLVTLLKDFKQDATHDIRL